MNLKTVSEAGGNMTVYTVYELELPDGTFYAGMTSNLEERLRRHRSGDGTNGQHLYVDYGILGVYNDRYTALEAEDVAIERLMALGVCANRKRSGNHYSENYRTSSREMMRRLREGEKMMYGRTNMRAFRHALNGDFLIEVDYD